MTRRIIGLKNRILNFFSLYKNALEHGKLSRKHLLRLDQIYFCKKNQEVFCLFAIKNKRTPWTMPISDVIRDKSIIGEIHPLDAFIIGITLQAKKYCVSIDYSKISKLKRYINTIYPYKNKSLYIASEDLPYSHKDTSFVLKTYVSKKSFRITLKELLQDIAIISLLNPLDALSVAFQIQENNIKFLCDTYA